MKQTTETSPTIALFTVPQDTTCPAAHEDVQVIQLDVIDLAEPEEEY
ncbi:MULTISPECIES: hypothetical protein [Aeromonas]|uniref:Uncharacterized protein n=2 Tax=Aeromonas TaxID=642 RepID=A0ABU9J8Q3_AEREN|nr:hypothetical protein [Aeromonas enteropelogenes]MBL0520009.1 hypothetical protein [Aeromonas enteropelogenes]MCZ0750792.1 hypothetical protein [Aeromonas enteropelogenes]UAK73692.1 hypothetical protein K8O95_09660 [Aeromonas enteropelogenes]UBH29430.1 hypothetical protein LA358_09475 [Aeromonas enteropelogenes]UBH57557.1 hypothetical protein LA341_06505 [Aeromonas enteropelogenes]